MKGSVVSFDDDKGYGLARAADGQELFFHCTQISDGSRTIEPGVAIEFDVVPGHRGRYEAAAVRRANS